METEIFIGIAVLFAQGFLTVGGLLVALKLLHHLFELEHRNEPWSKYRK